MSSSEKVLKDNCREKRFPFEIVKVDEGTNKELLQYFKGERTGLILVGPKRWCFLSGYEEQAINYYNFEVRPDDVWIVTYPRSGTTVMQEMVWLLTNNFDYKKAMEKALVQRFPFLEYNMLFHPEVVEELVAHNKDSEEKQNTLRAMQREQVWKFLQQKRERRFIKTHLPLSLLPPDLLTKGCKVIYIARNPKDVAVSYYHLYKLFKTLDFVGDFQKFWDYFQKGLLNWSPYWEHVLEGWQNKNSENVLFVFYENMNKNLRGEIEKVASFLGSSITESELTKLEDHLKIENFRKNRSVGHADLESLGVFNTGTEGFIRTGKNSGWKAYFNPELNEKADRWIAEKLKGTDLRFPL